MAGALQESLACLGSRYIGLPVSTLEAPTQRTYVTLKLFRPDIGFKEE